MENSVWIIIWMQETGDTALNEIFERIRVAVFKNGIRTTEFFRDHDKLRSGIVTESQFKCGLSLAVGKEAQLSRAEIQKVVEYYRVADDRVQYREFCQMMENGQYMCTKCSFFVGLTDTVSILTKYIKISGEYSYLHQNKLVLK